MFTFVNAGVKIARGRKLRFPAIEQTYLINNQALGSFRRARVSVLHVVLAILVCFVVPFVAWKNKRRLAVSLAACLFVLQLVLIIFGLDSAGRTVMEGVITSGGAVKEVSKALIHLKEAQLSMRIVLVLSGVGLLLLAAVRRPTSMESSQK